jgi:hypothetical protein
VSVRRGGSALWAGLGMASGMASRLRARECGVLAVAKPPSTTNILYTPTHTRATSVPPAKHPAHKTPSSLRHMHTPKF